MDTLDTLSRYLHPEPDTEAPTTSEMTPTSTAGLLRIGELSRRLGVTPDLLRVWERRYGLLSPERTEGGFRLYSAADEVRVRAMQRYLAEGYAAAVAARMALRAPVRPPTSEGEDTMAAARAELGEALEAFHDVEAQAVIDRLFAAFSVEAVLRDVVLPYLQDVGERWARGEVSVGQEHFASAVLQGRLLGLARGFDLGVGPRALLACPPGERHDLGLLCFGIGLRDHGWRITFLGADVPMDTLADVADRLRPDLVVVCAESIGPIDAVIPCLGALAHDHPVALAGRGASIEAAHLSRARLLQDAPMAAAARVAAEMGRRADGPGA